LAGPKLTLPVALTVFPRDIPRLPRSWIEDTYSNLIHYGEADKGGHFAALDSPRSWSAKSAPACAPFVPDANARAQERTPVQAMVDTERSVRAGPGIG